MKIIKIIKSDDVPIISPSAFFSIFSDINKHTLINGADIYIRNEDKNNEVIRYTVTQNCIKRENLYKKGYSSATPLSNLSEKQIIDLIHHLSPEQWNRLLRGDYYK